MTKNPKVLLAARRRRRRYWWIGAVVAVVGLSAVVSDVAVRHAVGSRIAAAAANRLRTTPAVDVGGGPILLQVIGGQLGRVSLSATGAGLGPLRDVDLTVALTGIHLRRGGRPVSIGHATVTVVVSRSELAGLIGISTPARAGRGLPFGLTVTGVHPTTGGVEITLEARNATIS